MKSSVFAVGFRGKALEEEEAAGEIPCIFAGVRHADEDGSFSGDTLGLLGRDPWANFRCART